LVLIIVFIHFSLQLKFNPYESDNMNKLQIFSILANLVTIFGINFLAGQYYEAFCFVIAILIIVCHLLFLLFCGVTLVKQKKREFEI